MYKQKTMWHMESVSVIFNNKKNLNALTMSKIKCKRIYFKIYFSVEISACLI